MNPLRSWALGLGEWLLFGIGLTLSSVWISACVSKLTPTLPAYSPTAVTGVPIVPSPPVAETTAQASVPLADPQILWKSSRHASTFVVDAQGKNNDCARCHAPLNWMPTAIEDIPATCQTCKFNMPAPRPVTQADWKNIGCEQCHRTEKGGVTKQVAWLNATIAQFDTNADPYEPVRSNAEPCEKCHRDTFKMDFATDVHASLSCTDCHNTHNYTFEIMVTDVTNAQYARYLNKAIAAQQVKVMGNQVVGPYPGDVFHAHRHEKRIDAGEYVYIPLDSPDLHLTFPAGCCAIDGKTFGVKTPYENHPMVMVSWFGARAYCNSNGWALPTEAEWEKAARGTDGRAFPWGGDIARNNANFHSSRDPFEKNVPGLGDTTPVGFYNGKTYEGYATLDSPSPFGAYDMAGNVWQWTADVYEGIHYRYMRGGSKGTYEYNLRTFSRNNAAPTYVSPEVGSRCVRH